MFAYDDHVSMVDIFAILSITIPAGWIVWRFLRARYMKVKEFFQALQMVVDSFHEMKTLIERELKTNHGSSIKDAVNELRVAISTIDGKFRAYVSYANLLGWESDENGLCVWVSPALMALVGRDESHFIGDAWHGLIAPEDRMQVTQEWEDSIRQRRAFILEYSLLHREGGRIRIMAETHCIRDYEGRVRGHVGVMRKTGD